MSIITKIDTYTFLFVDFRFYFMLDVYFFYLELSIVLPLLEKSEVLFPPCEGGSQINKVSFLSDFRDFSTSLGLELDILISNLLKYN